jgi:glycosyltransferase involved in cell wall biosynthesis
MKHNPELIAKLAETFAKEPSVRVVINSEGIGADFLKKAKDERGLNNLTINGYQPFERMPEVLGTADVLVTILEPEAGVFSVPSKTLSYLCAGRTILGAMPQENLAAKIIAGEEAGQVVDPHDLDGFLASAKALFEQKEALSTFGQNGRNYAETTFSIDRITDRFEQIFIRAEPLY